MVLWLTENSHARIEVEGGCLQQGSLVMATQMRTNASGFSWNWCFRMVEVVALAPLLVPGRRLNLRQLQPDDGAITLVHIWGFAIPLPPTHLCRVHPWKQYTRIRQTNWKKVRSDQPRSWFCLKLSRFVGRSAKQEDTKTCNDSWSWIAKISKTRHQETSM